MVVLKIDDIGKDKKFIIDEGHSLHSVTQAEAVLIVILRVRTY